MLLKLHFIQCLVYLGASPLLLSVVTGKLENYPYIILVGVVFCFLAVLLLAKKKSSNFIAPHRLDISINYKFLTLIFFIGAVISYKHGLYNSRIGSEDAAVLRGSIDPIEIVAWRLGYLICWLATPILILKIALNKDSVKKTCALVIFSFGVFGMLSSRAAPILALLIFAVVVQNLEINVRKKTWAYLISFGLAGVFIRSFISTDEFEFSVFIVEIFERSNGASVFANYFEYDGGKLFNSNYESVAKNIATINPFSDESRYLKSIGSTSVKNYMLERIGSDKIDFVFFYIADAYAIFGIAGVFLSTLVIAFVARRIDQRIITRGNIKRHQIACGVALVYSLISLESELVGLIRAVIVNTAVSLFVYHFLINVKFRKHE